MKNKDELIARANALITMGEKVLATETAEGQSKSLVNEQQFHDFRISALSFFSRVFGELSTFYECFRTEVTHHTASRTRRGIGVLSAARKELQDDWLSTTRGTITREMLLSMIDLAVQQLEQDNRGAAAAIAGAVLEQGLRCLCQAGGIPLTNDLQGKAVAKKGLQLTGEAYKKKLYERQDNKAIIAWLELCDQAAKGDRDAVSATEVKNLLKGVRGFLAKMKY